MDQMVTKERKLVNNQEFGMIEKNLLGIEHVIEKHTLGESG